MIKYIPRKAICKITLNVFIKVKDLSVKSVITKQQQKAIFRHTSNQFIGVKDFHVQNAITEQLRNGVFKFI